MKKFITLLLVLICISSLVGCSKKEKYEIGILIPSGSTDVFVYSEVEIHPIGNKLEYGLVLVWLIQK